MIGKTIMIFEYDITKEKYHKIKTWFESLKQRLGGEK